MKQKSGLSLLSMMLLVATFLGYSETISGQTENLPSPLKVENPNTLHVDYKQYGKCPFTKKSIDEMIDGLLVRARLKRSTAFVAGLARSAKSGFWLRVEVLCDRDEEPPFLYCVNVGFAEYVSIERSGETQRFLMYHNPYRYGSIGTYGKDNTKSTGFVRNAIRDRVEDALTDYLKANFDL